MERLNQAQLDRKIDSFISRKTAQHPELQQSDGVPAGKMWQTEGRSVKKFWEALNEGSPRRPIAN